MPWLGMQRALARLVPLLDVGSQKPGCCTKARLQAAKDWVCECRAPWAFVVGAVLRRDQRAEVTGQPARLTLAWTTGSGAYSWRLSWGSSAGGRWWHAKGSCVACR